MSYSTLDSAVSLPAPVATTRRLPAWALLGVTALLLAVVAAVLTPMNAGDVYDQDYALIWGRELAHGTIPHLKTLGGSTPHPLTILISAALSPLGRGGARDALAFVNLIAWGVIVVAVGAIFAQLLGRAAGVFAALAVIANVEIFDFVGASSSDALFVALVLVSVALELQMPRHRRSLVLLGIAGLTRPEAWLLAGVYWLWLFPGSRSRDRLINAAIAFAAPVLWTASDVVVAGQAFYSLHETQAGGAALRPTGVTNIVPQLRASLSTLLDWPELAGFVVTGAALWKLRTRYALIPAAVLTLTLAGFMALGVAKLPMPPRYMMVPATLITGAGGAALASWPRLRGRARTGLMVAAGVVLLLAVTHVPGRVSSWRVHNTVLRVGNERFADLRATLARVSTRPCKYMVSYKYRSAVVYETGLPLGRVVTMREPVARGLAVIPASSRPGFAYGAVIPTRLYNAPTVASGADWKVVDAGCPPAG